MKSPLAPANEELIKYLTMGASISQRTHPRSPVAALEAPRSPRSSLQLESITLACCDLPELQAFYTDLLGLQEFESDKSNKSVTLGRQRGFLKLEEHELWSFRHSREPGMFHWALRFENAAALTSTLLRVLYQHPELYRGSADHGYATSFYVDDPEGNTIELTIDAPRSSWPMNENGLAPMPMTLDEVAWTKEHYLPAVDENWTQEAAELSHVHFKVADVKESQAFYSELGLSPVMELPSVAFLSNESEHHLIAFNSWNTFGQACNRRGLGLIAVEFKRVGQVAAGEQVAEPVTLSDPSGVEVTVVDSTKQVFVL